MSNGVEQFRGVPIRFAMLGTAATTGVATAVPAYDIDGNQYTIQYNDVVVLKSAMGFVNGTGELTVGSGTLGSTVVTAATEARQVLVFDFNNDAPSNWDSAGEGLALAPGHTLLISMGGSGSAIVGLIVEAQLIPGSTLVSPQYNAAQVGT